MNRYPGFNEWLLGELGEESCLRRTWLPPVKQSTLDEIDRLAAIAREDDRLWQANREEWFADWYRERPTEDFSEYVNHMCEQIRSGKP